MPIHMMYLTVLSAVLLVSWVAATAEPPAPELTAGHYCVDGTRVYAPGRVEAGRAVVIWADTGRLHHIEIEQLSGCEEEE